VLRGGATPIRYSEAIAGTEDAWIYLSERTFLERGDGWGYRVPSPSGRYRVTLHFAEVQVKAPFRRTFDVLIEGRKFLEGYEPGAVGFATADRKTFEVEVRDGTLDIGFRRRLGSAQICGIEVERIGDLELGPKLETRPRAPEAKVHEDTLQLLPANLERRAVSFDLSPHFNSTWSSIPETPRKTPWTGGPLI